VSILLVIAPALAALLYLLAWRRSLRAMGAAGWDAGADPALPGRPGVRELGSALMLAGLAVHAVALHAGMRVGGSFHFGFALALSATLWVGVLLLWFEGLSVRIEALRVGILPVAAVAVLLPLAFPGIAMAVERSQPLFLPHLVVGTLAYGVLMLAALHALLMTATSRALHRVSRESSPLSRWIEQLPALMVLERMLFRLIALGFGLLTLTALSGIVFSEEVFGRALRLDHKTVFALIAWALFGALLVGRRLWGWRGRTALRLTLAGFGVLLLAYVGSRFVLEVILRRV
jgi:ABC-type uncharacterized transport system permease subunit